MAEDFSQITQPDSGSIKSYKVSQVAGVEQVDGPTVFKILQDSGVLDDNGNTVAEQITDLKGSVASLETQVAENTSVLSTVETNVNSSLSSMNDKLDAVDTEINSLKTNIETNTSDIAELKSNGGGDVSALTTRVSTLETEVSGLTTSVSTNTSDIAELKSNGGGDVSALTTRVSTLETEVSGLTTSVSTNTSDIAELKTNSGDVSALTTRVSNLETEVSTNTTSIASLETDDNTNKNNIALINAELGSLDSTASDYKTVADRLTSLESNSSGGDVSALATRVTTLENDNLTNKNNISQNTSDISSLKIGFNNNTSSINNINTETIPNILTDISNVENDVQTNKTSIARIDAELGVMDSTVSGYKTVATRLTTLENGVSSNATKITNLTNALNETNSNLETDNNTNKNNIALINAELGSLDSTASGYITVADRLTTLETDNATNQTNIGSNTSALSNLSNDVAILTTDVSSLTTAVSNNTTDISTIKTEIAGLTPSTNTNSFYNFKSTSYADIKSKYGVSFANSLKESNVTDLGNQGFYITNVDGSGNTFIINNVIDATTINTKDIIIGVVAYTKIGLTSTSGLSSSNLNYRIYTAGLIDDTGSGLMVHKKLLSLSQATITRYNDLESDSSEYAISGGGQLIFIKSSKGKYYISYDNIVYVPYGTIQSSNDDYNFGIILGNITQAIYVPYFEVVDNS